MQSRLEAEEDWRSVDRIRVEMGMVERRLALAERRDSIQATRPPDCWCLGTGGRRIMTVNIGDPNSEVVWLETCGCPDGQAEAMRRDRLIPEAREKASTAERNGKWARSGIPLRFQDCRLGTWPTARRRADILAMLTPRARSLYIWGPFGVGKTGLAVGYAWDYLTKMNPITLRFVTVPDLLASLRATYSTGQTEEHIITLYSRCGLLVLDDLGAEQVKDTGWLEDRLYRIIGHRHAEELPTVFTSNLDLDHVADRVGPRVTDRIAEMVGRGNVLNLTGCPNLREG